MAYNILRMLIYPFIFLVSMFKPDLKNFIKKRLFQELNFRSEGDYIWIHCASVGEVNLSEPVVKKFLDNTEYSIILTVMTDTGMETAKKKYGEKDRVALLYFPLDDLFAIKKILKKINLKELVIVETEIWPNLIRQCSKLASVAVINGRISDKSINSYRKFRWYLKRLFKDISFFIMQSELDKQRIIELGARASKVKNYGNLKFDIKLPDYTEKELEELREKLGIGKRKVFVAGSTRGGEEEKVIEVFERLENYLLILVPRHIERCPEIEDRLLKAYPYTKWSELEKYNGAATEIILVDKIGVLRKLYAISDVAFVGGTLVNIGGHSLLEPLYYGKFPIFGKYLQNVRDIAGEIEKRGIGFRIENTSEFLEAIGNIESGRLDANKISSFFRENSASGEKTFQLLVDII